MILFSKIKKKKNQTKMSMWLWNSDIPNECLCQISTSSRTDNRKTQSFECERAVSIVSDNLLCDVHTHLRFGGSNPDELDERSHKAPWAPRPHQKRYRGSETSSVSKCWSSAASAESSDFCLSCLCVCRAFIKGFLTPDVFCAWKTFTWFHTVAGFPLKCPANT